MKNKMMYVNQIFSSISGEVCSFTQGRRCTFIRLAGCNLKCDYCDTKSTQDINNSVEMSVDRVAQTIHKMNCKYIMITGGEPLLHTNLPDLIVKFDSTYKFCIETNGTKKIPYDFTYSKGLYGPQINFVVDYKIQYKTKMRCMYTVLGKNDFIKFVVDSESLLDESIKVQKRLVKKFENPLYTPTFAYSVVRSSANTKINDQLYRLILDKLEKNNLDAVLNFQIHKEINVR